MRVSIDAILAAFDGPLLLVDDDRERERIKRVLEASRPAVENAIYRVSSEALSTANDNLDGARADLRLVENGIEVEIVEEAEGPSNLASDFSLSPGDVEKLTLRIIEPLKKVDAEAAGAEGRSLNNWISSALTRHLERGTRQGRRDTRRAAREARRASRGGDGDDDDLD